MKNIMNGYRAFLLQEGKLEREATQITRDIIKKFRKLVDADTIHQSRVNYHWIEARVPNSLKNVADVSSIQVKVVVPGPYEGPHANRPTRPVEITAYFGTINRVPNTLYVQLVVNKEIATNQKELKNSIAEWYPTLKSLVRHELEHAYQKVRTTKRMPGTEKYQGSHLGKNPRRSRPEALIYFSSPEEREAYVAGLYKEAKITKTPFVEVLDAWIAGQRFTTMLLPAAEDDPTDEDIRKAFDDIREDYLDYARQRFPKAVQDITPTE